MSDLFVLQMPLAELILRATVIYFFLLLVMRAIGRHEFGQLTPFGLILLLIISESISGALTAGLVSASTLLLLSVLISIGQYRSKRIRKIVSPEALKVIEDGRFIEKSLRREVMTHDDLIERLRVSPGSKRCGSPTSRATVTYRRSPTGTGRRPQRRRRRNDRRHSAVSGSNHKNVGSVRFELTIDGSLRHASVLQRVIIR